MSEGRIAGLHKKFRNLKNFNIVGENTKISAMERVEIIVRIAKKINILYCKEKNLSIVSNCVNSY